MKVQTAPKFISKLAATAFLATLVGSFVAQADTYKVDAAASKLTWKATKKLKGGHNGTVDIKEGTVEVNAKNEVTGAKVVADMSKIKNDDLASSPEDQKKLITHLSSPDFFDVTKKGNETTTFVLKSIKKEGATYMATGDLTMIGVTKPVDAFPVKFTVDKGVAKGEGTMKVDRTKWGLKYGSSLIQNLTVDKVINDQIEIGFNITAKK